MIFLVDNYDSFVFNLARYLRRLGQETQVVRNDAIRVDDLRRASPDAVVLSPGPCGPAEAGICIPLVAGLYRKIPILGVCLGHQVIAQALGATVRRSRQPVHGRTSLVRHTGQGLFAGMPTPFEAARYHSLAVDEQTLPDELEATAWSDDGEVMAIEHRDFPIVGWQFHPESILTPCGYQLLARFLARAGLPVANVPAWESERRPSPSIGLPAGPVTF